MNEQERVAVIERQLAAMTADVQMTCARVAQSPQSQLMRIAQIQGDPQSDDNAFDIQFQDGKFTEEAGEQEVTYRARQVASGVVVCNVADEKVPADTRVPAIRFGRRWWTWYTEGGEAPPSYDQIEGLDGVFYRASNPTHPDDHLEDVSHNEDRHVHFNPPGEEHWGSADGLTWDDDEHRWEVSAGKHLFWLGIRWGARAIAFPPEPGHILTTTFNGGYVKIQHRPSPWDDEDEWEDLSESRLNLFAPTSGIDDESGREFYWHPQNNRIARVVVGAQQSGPKSNQFYSDEIESFRVFWSIQELSF